MSPYNRITPYEILDIGYAHERNIYGRNIGVAILDTGIYPHEDFLKPYRRITYFQDFVNNRQHMYDNNGHGSHVAGIIGSAGVTSHKQFIGVAPACHIIALKVLDAKGNGKVANVLKGIQWIIKNKEHYNIRIVNISIGTKSTSPNPENTTLIQGVDSLWDNGLVVCVAAGNEGPVTGSITTPGLSRKVITVGSSNDNRIVDVSGTRVKNYSSRGPTISCICKPEIVAPGSNIISCANRSTGYTIKSGTSMSTPFVSGAIALLLERYPNLTNKEVKMKLYHSCLNYGLTYEQQGWGILNIQRLLEAP